MISITLTKTDIATLGRRAFQAIGRKAIAAVLAHWASVFLPLHFKSVAHLRYPDVYQRRDRRTDQLKRERKPWPFGEHTQAAIGEVAPLVFSGRTRERARNPKIVTTARNYETYHGEAIMDVPSLNFSAGKRINTRNELLATNDQEWKTLNRIYGESYTAELVAAGLRSPRQTRRIAA